MNKDWSGYQQVFSADPEGSLVRTASGRIEDGLYHCDAVCPRCRMAQTVKMTVQELLGGKTIGCTNTETCGPGDSSVSYQGMEFRTYGGTRLENFRFSGQELVVDVVSGKVTYLATLTVDAMARPGQLMVGEQQAATVMGMKWDDYWHFRRDVDAISTSE